MTKKHLLMDNIKLIALLGKDGQLLKQTVPLELF